MLKVTNSCEELIREFFVQHFSVRPNRIQSNLHLTLYHGRRPLPGLREFSLPVRITIESSETRFMVLAPGGENPRQELNPRELSVGIRVTRRNRALPEILRLRESVFSFETSEIVESRMPTTAWTSCFGSKHYQPHIQLLRSWSKIPRDLTEVGTSFRSEIHEIDFDTFQIESRRRVDGKWISTQHD